MKNILQIFAFFLVSTAAFSSESKIDLNAFAQQYFNKMVATQ